MRKRTFGQIFTERGMLPKHFSVFQRAVGQVRQLGENAFEFFREHPRVLAFRRQHPGAQIAFALAPHEHFLAIFQGRHVPLGDVAFERAGAEHGHGIVQLGRVPP